MTQSPSRFLRGRPPKTAGAPVWFSYDIFTPKILLVPRLYPTFASINHNHHAHTMDSFSRYFSDGAWYLFHWNALVLIVFLAILLLIYVLSDYRRAILLSLLFAGTTLVGTLMSAAGIFHIRPGMAAFVLPVLATLLAVFNIFGAGNRPSAVLEKTGFALTLLFGLTFGLSSAPAYGGDIPAILIFTLGLIVGTLVLALIVLCISSLAAFFGINRRDYVIVLSAVAIGLMIPYLIRNFPFTIK